MAHRHHITNNKGDAIVRSERDFLFIRPGGKWHTLRQDTVWDNARLARLAKLYSKQGSKQDKRTFLENFVDSVWKVNGRFLRANVTKTPSSSSNNDITTSWSEEYDKDVIVRDVMSILRHLRKRNKEEKVQVFKSLEELSRKLGQLETLIGKLHSTVKQHLQLTGESGENQSRMASLASGLSSTKVRKTLKLIDAVEKDVVSCKAKLSGATVDA